MKEEHSHTLPIGSKLEEFSLVPMLCVGMHTRVNSTNNINYNQDNKNEKQV